MKAFIRKYYQEVIAGILIVGFWGSVWGFHEFHYLKAEAFKKANTIQYDPSIANK